MNNHFDLSDEEFERQFDNSSLPPSLFNHEAHLRLAWIHIRREGIELAIDTVCNQIMAYVNHLGAQDKYNHTLTVAAVKIVDHFYQRAEADNFSEYIQEFPRLKTSFKELITSHYSFDIFNSEEAKQEYLEPDLVPFE